MAVNIGYISDILAEIAPRELAEDYDNVGLLAGSARWTCEAILCALDLTDNVVNEAIARGAQLIVTHHPILFHARKNIREDDPEGALLAKLVRARIAVYAMHTNYDNAEDGVNSALAEALGIDNVTRLESGVIIGDIPPMPLIELAERVRARLGGVVRRYGDISRAIKRVAALGGSGGSYAEIALNAGADAFITGEISYHTALDMHAAGMCALEAGHAATERPAIAKLADAIRARLHDVNVYVSDIESFL